MRRRTFLGNKYTIAGGNITASKSVTGDVCLYEKGTDSLVIIPYSLFNIGTYPTNSYSPVGVVVIPGSHNVYGDGSCAVISLKEMNYSTPDTGSTSYQDMGWGQNSTDISNLTNYNQVVSLGTMDGEPQTTVQDATNYGYMPSDKGLTGKQCPHDTDTYYHSSTSDTYCYIPSPYLTDESRNPMYYQTSSPSSSANAMSDFDGVGNTEILCSLATVQSDWKIANTIINESSSGYSPAACCCWRYHTEGTKQGDWYLPAMGELGYMVVKFNKINQTIETLISAYGSSVGVQVNDTYHWSSSEYSRVSARYVHTRNCDIYARSKDNNYDVRAFLRVK